MMTTTFKLFLVLFTVPFLIQAGEGESKNKNTINISTEKKFAYGYTKGRYIKRDGKLIYIPGVPKFEKRTIGTTISIGNIAVTDHGIAIDIDLKKVARGDQIQTDKGHRISLMTSNYHTLNGQRYKIMGTNKGRVYFKESKGKGIISAALTDGKVSDSTAEKTKKSESGETSKTNK